MSRNLDDQTRRRPTSRSSQERDRGSGQYSASLRSSADNAGGPNNDGHRSFRSWVRQAVTQEEGRADVRGLLRDHTDTTTRRASEGRFRERRSISSLAPSERTQPSFHSEESVDESSYESGEAVGPYDAGDPTTEMDKHHCELPSDIENAPIPPLPMHPTVIQVLQKFLLPYLIVWPKHPRVKVVIRSTARIRYEQKRHVRSKYWYTIHPLSRIRYHWERFIALVLFVTLIVEPIDTAFELADVVENCSPIITILRLFCLMDCFFNFLTGDYIAEENNTVLQPRKIARNYLRTYFIIDSIPSINVCWVFNTPAGSLAPFIVLQEFIRLARLRIIDTQVTYSMTQLGFRLKTISVVMLIVKILSVQHTLAMLHLYSIRFCCTKRDLKELTRRDCKYSWLVIGHYLNTTWRNQIIISAYRAAILSMSITIPQGPPHTQTDTYVVITNIVVGAFLLIYIFIHSMFYMISKEYNKIAYEQIMMNVRDYVHYKKLTPDLKDRLIVFYEYSLGKSAYNEPVIKKNLSRHLLAQVKQHSYREAVRSCGLFRGLPRSLCSFVVQYLTPVVLMRGDVFLRYGDYCEAMFFVHCGALALVTNNGKETEHLQDGDYFGESGLLQPDGMYTATVVALEMTVVLRLERDDFLHTLEAFPPFARRMREVAIRRAEVSRVVAEHAEDVESSDSASGLTTPDAPGRDRP